MKFRGRQFTIVVGALVLVTSPAAAVPLSDLFAGGTLTAGDKAFFDWTLNQGSSPIDLSAIEVTPLTDQPSNPGLRFTVSDGVLSLAGAGFLDLDFRYTVTAPAALIKDASVAITDYERSGDGSVFLFQDILDVTDTPLESNFVFAIPGGQQLSDSADFAVSQAITIANAIDVGVTAGSAGLLAFEQRVSQVPQEVPEPGVLALLVPGLAALAGIGAGSRRRRGG